MPATAATTKKTSIIKNEKPLPFKVGDQVEVEARTWVGICKYGGVGSVKKCYYDENGDAFVDVSYNVSGGSEKRIELDYVKPLTYLSRSRVRKPNVLMNIANLKGKGANPSSSDPKGKKRKSAKAASTTSKKQKMTSKKNDTTSNSRQSFETADTARLSDDEDDDASDQDVPQKKSETAKASKQIKTAKSKTKSKNSRTEFVIYEDDKDDDRPVNTKPSQTVKSSKAKTATKAKSKTKAKNQPINNPAENEQEIVPNKKITSKTSNRKTPTKPVKATKPKIKLTAKKQPVDVDLSLEKTEPDKATTSNTKSTAKKQSIDNIPAEEDQENIVSNEVIAPTPKFRSTKNECTYCNQTKQPPESVFENVYDKSSNTCRCSERKKSVKKLSYPPLSPSDIKEKENAKMKEMSVTEKQSDDEDVDSPIATNTNNDIPESIIIQKQEIGTEEQKAEFCKKLNHALRMSNSGSISIPSLKEQLSEENVELSNVVIDQFILELEGEDKIFINWDENMIYML